MVHQENADNFRNSTGFLQEDAGEQVDKCNLAKTARYSPGRCNIMAVHLNTTHHGDIPKRQHFESIKLHHEVDSICQTPQGQQPHLVSWEGVQLVLDQGRDILRKDKYY